MEEEDCKPMFEGLPEIKGSPSPEDSDGSEERIMPWKMIDGMPTEFVRLR